MNNTLLGIVIGIILAFVVDIAKAYVENRIKLNNLKKALYTEIIGNCYELNMPKDVGEFGVDWIIQHRIRTECYKHAIQNELTVFYQLPESLFINILYNGYLISLQDTSKEAINDEVKFNKVLRSMFHTMANAFLNNVSIYFYIGNLDKKLLKKLVTKEMYKYLIVRGEKEALKKNVKPFKPDK